MRQIGAEKEDPLRRIQEEINEVARRERELRIKSNLINGTTVGNEDQTGNLDNISGMSDDSGISSSSSPINGMSSNIKETATPPNISNGISAAKPVNYNRSHTVAPMTVTSTTPLLPVMKLTRTMSTPQIFMPTKRFNVNSGQKGMMQRFIASRGKFSPAGNRSKDSILTSIELNRSPIYMSPEISPPIIERDDDGRPLRRGYVPVEEKIQKELIDIKNRESELKRFRRLNKLRQSQPDLLDDINDSIQFDSAEDSEEDEHCFPPGKLRASKSIGELCDVLHTNSSLSPRDSPSPQFHRSSGSGASGQKPVMSLAQLCDVNPEEAPSSHRLIAQWENLIQQRQEVA